MRDRPDWMTMHDLAVLWALADPDIVTVLSPTIVAINLDIHRVTASRALRRLVDHSLAVQHQEGRYEITEAGRDLLAEIGP